MRKQIRFNNEQEKELALLMAKVRTENHSEAIHLAIQYALKYFNIVTKALETDEFEIAIVKRTKHYRKKSNQDYTHFG